ncbi:hypothetical protein [Flavobacterium laiguense]|nr:hypothetical protein [Flavobacterium laiguense]
MIIESEDDIKSGHIHSQDEVKKMMNEPNSSLNNQETIYTTENQK